MAFDGKTSKKKKGVNQKFCSPECQHLARRARINVICKHCGKSFETRAGQKNRKKYCSLQCKFACSWESQEEHDVIFLLSEILAEQPHRQYTSVWLTNPETKKRMRIDAYFPEHNLMVEYDGRQHREFSPLYHKTTNDFNAQLRRDALKEELATERGFNFLRIADTEPRTIEHLTQRLDLILR